MAVAPGRGGPSMVGNVVSRARVEAGQYRNGRRITEDGMAVDEVGTKIGG